MYERIYYKIRNIKNQLLGLNTGGTAIYKRTGLVVCEIKQVGGCAKVAKQLERLDRYLYKVTNIYKEFIEIDLCTNMKNTEWKSY